MSRQMYSDHTSVSFQHCHLDIRHSALGALLIKQGGLEKFMHEKVSDHQQSFPPPFFFLVEFSILILPNSLLLFYVCRPLILPALYQGYVNKPTAEE